MEVPVCSLIRFHGGLAAGAPSESGSLWVVLVLCCRRGHRECMERCWRLAARLVALKLRPSHLWVAGPCYALCPGNRRSPAAFGAAICGLLDYEPRL